MFTMVREMLYRALKGDKVFIPEDNTTDELNSIRSRLHIEAAAFKISVGRPMTKVERLALIRQITHDLHRHELDTLVINTK